MASDLQIVAVTNPLEVGFPWPAMIGVTVQGSFESVADDGFGRSALGHKVGVGASRRTSTLQGLRGAPALRLGAAGPQPGGGLPPPRLLLTRAVRAAALAHARTQGRG